METGTTPTKSATTIEGFIQNVADINERAFSFEVQGKSSSQRVVCFSPMKRKSVSEKLKSPVKVTKIRKSNKGTDYIFGDESTLEDIDVDFQPIDYETVTVGQLPMRAMGSFVTLEAKILSKRRKIANEKKLDTYAICDNSGASKLNVWEECVPELVTGKVYKLADVKVRKDPYGNIELQVGRGSKIELSKATIQSTNVQLDPSFVYIKGEVMKVDEVKKYKMCSTCHRKVGPPAGGLVTCESENCRGSMMKEKFCNDGIYAKFIFYTEKKEKLSLTMFTEEIKVIVPNADSLSEDGIKNAIIKTDVMSLSKSESNIVTSISVN